MGCVEGRVRIQYFSQMGKGDGSVVFFLWTNFCAELIHILIGTKGC
jgi:hypothetical protein